MGFSESKESGGVTVVKVDGQLIIGNRHELKDLVQAALDPLMKGRTTIAGRWVDGLGCRHFRLLPGRIDDVGTGTLS